MKNVWINTATLELLKAHAIGGDMKPPLQIKNGFAEIELDDEVHAKLVAIDIDADKAIRVLCTNGVGHA